MLLGTAVAPPPPAPPFTPSPSPLAGRPVTLVLRPTADRPSTPFAGWGTALAWFANVTGGWPEAERSRLADLFYTDGGLGWTIARYSIGGGNAADTSPYLRTGATVPGFWRLGARRGRRR
jgi:hypothetical protein